MQRNLKVLLIKPDKLPRVINIKNTLAEKQKQVGGYIEYTYLDNCDDVAIICNEEGKIQGLPPNRDVGHDIIMGDFLIVGDDSEIGEDRSLTDNQIQKYKKMFNEQSIIRTKEKFNKLLENNFIDKFSL